MTNRPLRVCHFTSLTALTTGMPICTLATIELLHDSPGIDVSVITPDHGDMTAALSDQGVRCFVVPFSRFSIRGGLGLLFRLLAGFAPAFVRSAVLLRRRRVDIVHFSDIIDAPFYPIARLAGVKCVAHLRVNLENPLLRALFGLWARLFCDHVVLISSAVRKHAGLPETRATVVHDPGPDPAVFDPATVRPMDVPAPKRNVVVCACADFREVKGHENFVVMASAVAARAKSGTTFVIAGGEVEGREEYRRWIIADIDQRGLGDRFVLPGSIAHSEIPSLFAAADIFVHAPNYQEGLGIVVLEAGQMGKPVVAFDSGGVRECIVEGEGGFLVPHGDTDVLISRVLQLVDDPSLRKKMGRSAREYVLDSFSRERYLSRLVDVYNNVS